MFAGVVASTTVAASSGAVEVVVVDVAVAEALVLGVHALAGKGFLLLAVALLGLLFLVPSTAASFEISWQLPFIWPCALA
jgi:hypothetical protein